MDVLVVSNAPGAFAQVTIGPVASSPLLLK